MPYVVVLALLLGLIPATIAHKKGRSFLLWWLYGSLFIFAALPHALFLEAALIGGHLIANSPASFDAHGVVGSVPYRIEPDGTVLALVDGVVVRFKSMRELEDMVKASGRGR